VKDPIRIHPQDDNMAARARHKRIEMRLDELGIDQVRTMQGHALPTNWDPIIRAWLKGERLEDEKPDGDNSGRA
jgi:hypothetical protein